MAAPTLVEAEIETGRRATQALDDAGLKVPGTFWLYYPEAEEWRFVTVTPIVDSDGPLEAYSRIDKALRPIAERLPLSRVVALSPKDRLFRALRKAAKTGPGISAGTRLSRSVFNDVFIEDALIYRLN